MTAPRVDEHDFDLALRSWLREDEDHLTDRARRVGEVMRGVDATSQRRRWWPLLLLGRRTRGQAPRPLTQGGLSRLAVLAVVSVLAVGTSLALYSAAQVPPLSGTPGAGPLTADDEALLDRDDALWGSDPLAAEVAEVYAEDAVYTVMWTDQAVQSVGHSAIADRMGGSTRLAQGEADAVRLRLPDSSAGDRRYLAVHPEMGGMPCAFWIRGDRITRHDCIVPMATGDSEPFTPGAPSGDMAREDLVALLAQAWNGDRASFEQVTSPDIIHAVGFSDRTVIREGIDEYWTVANWGGGVEALSPPIELPAPEGELRWTVFSDVSRGTLCTFWARDGLIVRHDCVVPSRSY